MKKLFQISLSIFFLISCNNIVDDRPNVVESYLRNKISTESGNTIKLNNFQKTNGIEEENGKMYTMEWNAEIGIEQEIWKAGNGLEGYWQSFGIMKARPLGWASVLAGDPKHYNAGSALRLTGKSILQKTEQGWRVHDVTVRTSQVVNSGNTSNSSNANTDASKPVEKKVFFNKSDADAKKVLLGNWYGTIGKKEFLLNIENVGNGKLTGYNIAGKNKRPVTGSYSFYREGSACTLEFKEPGDDKWDGSFKLEMDLYSDEWGGSGFWNAFNGKLFNPVQFSRKMNDYPDDLIPSSSHEADKFIGIWNASNKDQLKISKSDNNFKVIFHPFQDLSFDLTGYFINGQLKCSSGQTGDTTTISLIADTKLKFVGEWENGSKPGMETYYFNK